MKVQVLEMKWDSKVGEELFAPSMMIDRKGEVGGSAEFVEVCTRETLCSNLWCKW